MIAVTGANGQLGRLVLKHLADLTDTPIRALVRSPEKAGDLASAKVSVRKADYDAPATLTEALDGVERLLLISGSEVGKRVPQHAAVIEAAKVAGVRFLAYTSILNAETSSMMLAQEHAATENLLKESGIPYVALRNGWYLENFAGKIPAALEHGVVVGASGTGKFAAAGREDYAEAAARVVSGTDLSTRVLELAGHPAFTLEDLAAELSRQTGRAVPFSNLSEEVYAGVLVQAGLPDGFAKALADSDRAAAQGELYSSSTALQDLIGHPVKSLSGIVTETLAATEQVTA